MRPDEELELRQSTNQISIEHDLFEMSSRAELMFMQSVDALTRLDLAIAERVVKADDRVDQIDLKIERDCLELLSSQQGTEEERRSIAAILKIITDVERAADLSVEIARCAINIESELGKAAVVDVPRLGHQARTMFHTAIEAYVRKDLSIVERVHESERAVDNLFLEIKDQILDLMRQNPAEVVPLSFLLQALGCIERVGDHAVNIADRVSYMITGEVRIHHG